MKKGVLLILLDEDGHSCGPYWDKGEMKIFETVEEAKKFQEENPEKKFRRMKVRYRE